MQDVSQSLFGQIFLCFYICLNLTVKLYSRALSYSSKKCNERSNSLKFYLSYMLLYLIGALESLLTFFSNIFLSNQFFSAYSVKSNSKIWEIFFIIFCKNLL